MNTTIVEKIKLLPFEKQREAENFIDFLLQKYQQPAEKKMKEIAEKRRRNFGNMKGQIWMADDFNKTPEDFKDYR